MQESRHAVGRLAQHVVRRPLPWLLGFAGVFVLAGIGLGRLQVDPDFSTFLPEGDPLVALLRHAQTQDSSRDLFLLVEGDGLQQHWEQLTESLRQSPFIEALASKASELDPLAAAAARQAPLYALDPQGLEQVAARLAPGGLRQAIVDLETELASDPLAGRERVLADPLGLRWIFADAAARKRPGSLDPGQDELFLDEGRAALLRIRGFEDPMNLEFSSGLIEDLGRRLAPLRFQAVGGYAAAHADQARLRGDLGRSTLWSALLVAAFLLATSRSLLVPLILGAPIVFSIVVTLALGGLVLGPLPPLAVCAAAVLTGTGIDFGIHVLARVREEARTASYAAAVRNALAALAAPLAMGAATSIVAFLALAFSGSSAIADFGILLAAGLLASLLASLLLLPALLRPLARRWSESRTDRPSVVVHLLKRLGDGARGPSVAVLLLAVGLGGWLIVAAFGLSFETDPRHSRPADDPLRLAQQEIETRLAFAPLPVTLMLPLDFDLERLHGGIDRLSASGVASHASGQALGMPPPAKIQRIGALRAAASAWRERFSADLAAKGFRPESFAAGLDDTEAWLLAEPAKTAPVADFFWQGRAYQSVSLHPPAGLWTRARRADFHAAVDAAFGDGVIVVDPYGISDVLAPVVARELKRASLLAATGALLLLLLGLRSLKGMVVAATPAVLGLGATLGLIVILGIPITPINFIALPMILGLGVDDGLHMVARLREGRGDPVLTTGKAVWQTSATTILGFGSLVATRTPDLRSLGLILSLGILISFLASILLLPWLARRMGGGAAARTA